MRGGETKCDWQKDIIVNMHIHTISSLHGFLTLKECIDVAVKEGLNTLLLLIIFIMTEQNSIGKMKLIE